MCLFDFEAYLTKCKCPTSVANRALTCGHKAFSLNPTSNFGVPLASAQLQVAQ